MPEDCKLIIDELYIYAPYGHYHQFEQTGDDDFSFSIPYVGRFRVNVYYKEIHKLLYYVS